MPKCPQPDCPGWIYPTKIQSVIVDKEEFYEVIHKCNSCEYTEYIKHEGTKVDGQIPGIPFEELYGATPYDVYKDDIEKFFQDEILDRYQFFERKDGIKVAKGFIWVASHGHFEALTVEPMDGNQFEIAVRFPHGEGRWETPGRSHKYSGYSISRSPFKFLGHDTGGH